MPLPLDLIIHSTPLPQMPVMRLADLTCRISKAELFSMSVFKEEAPERA